MYTEYFSSYSLDVDNVSDNVSPSENPNHASSHLLPNTSLIPKTLNRSSNSVNSHTSVAVFTVQSPTHTSASPVQSPTHTPSITSPVKPTFTHSSVSPVQSTSYGPSITSPVNQQSIPIHQCCRFSHHLTVLQSPLLLNQSVHQCCLFNHHLTVLQSPFLLNQQSIPIHQCRLFSESPSHTHSVTSPVKPSSRSHSSVSPVCLNTSSSCKPPLATDSALTTSNRHVNV